MKKKLTGLYLFTFFVWNLLSLRTNAQLSFSGGTYHSLFACNDGTANSWGNNVNGALGDGTTGTDRIYPVHVAFLSSVVKVSAGDFHSLFVRSDGTVWSCGNNSNGELGDGTLNSHNVPTQITSLSGIIAVAAGEGFSLFLKSDSTVWSCGRNSYGQLGDGTTVDKHTPVQVLNLTGIKDIAVGRNHSLFLKDNGRVYACGENFRGQLGIGNNQDKWTPYLLSITGIVAISAGWEHSLFLKGDSLWACGYNLYGQLGDGSNTNRNAPVRVGGGINGVVAIEAGGDHTLICKGNGTTWSCGKNNYGQLGDGTTVDKNIPQVIGVLNIVHVEAGAYHSLFLKNDGTLWACGGNFSGQLGDSTTTQRLTAVEVEELCTPLGVGELNGLQNLNSLNLLNQPASEILEAELHLEKNDNLFLSICDIQGRILHNEEIEGRVGENSLRINIGSYKSGIYFIKIYNKSLQLEKKIVKI